ncbi:MAG: 50S ribosomal protein L27 [Candidatus Omnitrophica bacterium]|nr:50S ribosomal protein L27 [Candidatus Omnitrophota bacterium]
MGGRVGGISSKYYCETAGIKVSGGQKVKSGTILTRQGDQWKRGLNVIGRSSLTAACDGEVYFTRRKNGYNKVITLINIKPSN